MFVGELFCCWIKAGLVAGAGRDETVTRLLAWMYDDPYEFCCRPERDAANALDRAGLVAGSGPSRIPSLLERVKVRCGSQQLEDA